RDADRGEQQAHVVVDLGDRGHRRPRVLGDRLLLDRDSRRQPLDRVDVRLLHLLQKLPGIRRQRLDIAPLPLGEQSVESQRRLPGPGHTGDDHQAVARDLEADVLQVVLAGAANDDVIHRTRDPSREKEGPGWSRRGATAAAVEEFPWWGGAGRRCREDAIGDAGATAAVEANRGIVYRMTRPRVYVETTIPSLYHEVRTSPDSVARRNWTRQWWESALDLYELVTSPTVLEELADGLAERGAMRLDLVRALPLLPIEPAITEIVESYIRYKLMPADPGGDAMHLALASYHK